MSSRPCILVVGHGAAGLCAALSAAERARELGTKIDVTIVEQTSAAAAGGGTRYSPSNMRFGTGEQLRAEFSRLSEEDARYDQKYFTTLADSCQPSIEWLAGHGVQFEQIPYYLSATLRYRPAGGGIALIEALTEKARQAGVRFCYEFEAREILGSPEGVAALRGVSSSGRPQLSCDSLVLACGGFQGNPDLLRYKLGEGGEKLRPISAGSGRNRGAGIQMALGLGAVPAGDWKGMHCEPIDPRAQNPAAVVLIYPFGIVVDRHGRRFFDEGAGFVHETWEEFSRAIHFEAPGRVAYALFDNRLRHIPDWTRAVRSEVEAVEASTIPELAHKLGIEPEALERTVSEFNAGVPIAPDRFDPSRCDGLASANLSPPKSNWARPITEPPFLAYPLVCGLAYTFGGLATDEGCRVLGKDGPVPHLYAAGEITGHFYGRAPNAVSVLRSIVFGRVAGRTAVEDLC